MKKKGLFTGIVVIGLMVCTHIGAFEHKGSAYVQITSDTGYAYDFFSVNLSDPSDMFLLGQTLISGDDAEAWHSVPGYISISKHAYTFLVNRFDNNTGLSQALAREMRARNANVSVALVPTEDRPYRIIGHFDLKDRSYAYVNIFMLDGSVTTLVFYTGQ
jgi:hypothetical protein